MSKFVEQEQVLDIVFGQFCASSDETEAALNAIIEAVKDLPYVCVRAVTCGECIHRNDPNRPSCIGRKPDFFCAAGVKKEGEVKRNEK